jgi:hypothetical protein
MSDEITTAFVKQYEANVRMLAQQQGSRLRPAVMTDTQRGKHAFVDQVGATTAVKKTTRHGDTPLLNSPHSRRRLSTSTYEWADLIDDADKVRLLIDPTNAYAINAANAMGRAMDDVIIAAALGTAYSGEEGSTTVALPSAQKIAVAGSSLTIAKILEAKRLLDKAEVDPSDPRFMAASSKEITNLLNTTEVKSADYNTVKALAAGQIDTFCGFKFIQTERLTLDGSGDRQCIAWAKTGLQMNLGFEVNTQIGPRADKSYSTQVYVAMDVGAARLEEVKVVEIACTP